MDFLSSEIESLRLDPNFNVKLAPSSPSQGQDTSKKGGSVDGPPDQDDGVCPVLCDPLLSCCRHARVDWDALAEVDQPSVVSLSLRADTLLFALLSSGYRG